MSLFEEKGTELPDDYKYEVYEKKIRCHVKTKQGTKCKLKAQDERGMCYIHLNSTYSHGRTDKYVPYETIGYAPNYIYHEMYNDTIEIERLLSRHLHLNELTTDIFTHLYINIPTLLSFKEKIEKVLELIQNIPKYIPYLVEIQRDMSSLYTNFKQKDYNELRVRYLQYIKLFYFYRDFYILVSRIYYYASDSIKKVYNNMYNIKLILYSIRHRTEHKLRICRKLENILDLPKDIIYYCVYPYLDACE